MKFTKSIAVMAAISVGIMFAVTANVDANAKVKHTVQNGDTISGLSQQYHVSQKKIQKAMFLSWMAKTLKKERLAF